MQSLDSAFSALADPTRRAIMARLARGEATVMELAEPFEMSQPAISRHLKVLETAGLIDRRAEGTKRHCRLQKHGIDAMEQWLAMMHKAMSKNYDRLDGVLAALQRDTKKGKPR
ncbi:MAG: metalloregulator ArsR/SmtB family transcription factor [Pseudomonadota bacterium]